MVVRIKRILKRWIVPAGFWDLTRKLKKKPQTTSVEASPQKGKYENTGFESLRNQYNGKRCFILASGPSINSQDLSKLKGEHCIAVSQFFLHDKINEIQPEFHCFAPQHYPFDNTTNEVIFNNYSRCYIRKPITFVGSTNYEFSYYNYINTYHKDKINAFFIDYNGQFQLNEQNYTDESVWDISKQPFGPRTVIYTAIQAAYFLGFTEIYLLGVDHDYIQDVGRDGHHFYKEENSYNDKNHLEMFSTERWFEEYFYRWKQYRLMRTFLDSKGIKIYNATNGGMLDVFEKVEFDQLF